MAALSLSLGACSSIGAASLVAHGEPSASATPVATPPANLVSSPEDAAARVIATDPRFAGATTLLPDSIGLTKWWEGLALDSGGYEIKLTLGWDDCPAGCIHHHTWTFDVAADGAVKLVAESGDPVPSGT